MSTITMKDRNTINEQIDKERKAKKEQSFKDFLAFIDRMRKRREQFDNGNIGE